MGDAVESDELLLVDEGHGWIVHRRIVAEQGHPEARKTIQGVLIYSYGSMIRTPRRRDDGLGYILVGLGPRTDAVWLAGNAIGLGLTLAAAFVFPGHGLIFAYLAVTVRLALYTQAAGWPGGEYFDQMLRLGLVAGFFEIFADYVLVRLLVSGRLVYLTRDAVLLESPLYMPFAWACVIVELGYVSVRLYSLFRGAPWGAWAASLVGGLTAGVFIGLYEYFAFRAGWWKYEPARVMIGPYCAAYIPLGECLMFLVMLPLLTWLGQRDESPSRRAFSGGIAFAAIILVSYFVAYVVLEGLP